MLGRYRWQTPWTSKHAHASCTADIDTSLHVTQVQRMKQYCTICCETQNNIAATAVTGESQNKDAAVLHILCRVLPKLPVNSVCTPCIEFDQLECFSNAQALEQGLRTAVRAELPRSDMSIEVRKIFLPKQQAAATARAVQNHRQPPEESPSPCQHHTQQLAHGAVQTTLCAAD